MLSVITRMIASFRRQASDEAQAQPNALTFNMISGVGHVACQDCGHAEELHAFTHGFGDDSDFTMSAQCQSCGAFKEFTCKGAGPHGLAPTKQLIEETRCDCGGSFSVDDALFCSSCGSLKLQYTMRYVT